MMGITGSFIPAAGRASLAAGISDTNVTARDYFQHTPDSARITENRFAKKDAYTPHLMWIGLGQNPGLKGTTGFTPPTTSSPFL
jgi:hypothetical protein